MAEAMIRSLKSCQRMSDVHVYDVNDNRLDVLKSRYGITKASSIDDAVKDAEFVVRMNAYER